MIRTRIQCLLCVTVYVLATTSYAQMSPEPEPIEEGLYLYTAGFSSKYLFELKNGTEICLDDYPSGVNVRCLGSSRYARFTVNGNFFRSEYHEPFFLAGNVNKYVRRWKNIPQSALIRCTLFMPKRNYRASVTFTC